MAALHENTELIREIEMFHTVSDLLCALRRFFVFYGDFERLNHRVEVVPNVLGAESAALLKSFFSRLRLR